MKRVSCLLLALSLAACGGGGGGGGGSTVPPASTQQPQANVKQVPTQRALAQQSLQTQVSLQSAAEFAVPSGTTLSSVQRLLTASARRVASAWRGQATHTSAVRVQSVTYGPCNGVYEEATVQVSANEEQDYIRYFYDAACTQISRDLFFDITAKSSTSATATGTETDYTRTGTISQYLTLSVALNGFGTSTPSFSAQIGLAPSPTAQQTVSVGVSCGVGVASNSCGFSGFDRVASISQDVGVTMNFTFSVTNGAVIAIPLSGNASGYTGALGTLGLTQGTFPAWNVTGGTLIDSVSFNGQFGYNSALVPVSGSLSISDTADDATVTLTASAQSLSGTIKQTSTGTAVATFTVDSNGNGTIAYSNGTTGQIVDWQIAG